MTKFTDQKKKEWQGNVAKIRSRKRSEYAAGPAINRWFMEIYERVVKGVKDNKDPRDIKLLKALDKIFFPYTKEWFFYDLKNTERALNKYFILKDKAVEPANSTLVNN